MFDKYEKNRQAVTFCRKGGAVESASLGDGGQITTDRQLPINVLHHSHLATITIPSFYNYTKCKETHHMTIFQYFFTTTTHSHNTKHHSTVDTKLKNTSATTATCRKRLGNEVSFNDITNIANNFCSDS